MTADGVMRRRSGERASISWQARETAPNGASVALGDVEAPDRRTAYEVAKRRWPKARGLVIPSYSWRVWARCLCGEKIHLADVEAPTVRDAGALARRNWPGIQQLVIESHEELKQIAELIVAAAKRTHASGERDDI